MTSFLNFNAREISRPLYRFTTFARLIELFRTKQFCLVRTSGWDDPFENLIVSARYKSKGGHMDSVLRHVVHGSCWTKKPVSDALWRIYSPDKLAVRIGSTPRLLGNALSSGLSKYPRSKWFVGKVQYLPQSVIVRSAASLAKEILTDKSEISAARSVLVKRRSFAHEDEVRVLVIDRHSQSKGGIVRVKVDPHAVVTSVMFDSRAPAEVKDMYKSFLRNDIGFKGRISSSTLYDLPDRLIVELEK